MAPISLRLVRPLNREAWALFLVVNTLNALDAALTWLAVGLGVAVEGNPVVGTIGLGGKLVLVVAASWLLAAVRPKALWVPAVALGAVVLWSAVNLAAIAA